MICTLLAFLSYIAKTMAGNQERTFIMIKPDGVQRGIVGEIIKRFEAKGFKLVAMKFMWVSEQFFYRFFFYLWSASHSIFANCTIRTMRFEKCFVFYTARRHRTFVPFD